MHDDEKTSDVEPTSDVFSANELSGLIEITTEFHMMPTFSQIGGARIGFFNATWPFAKLSATREGISLRCGFKFEFPKDKIYRLSRYKDHFSNGLQIQHNVSRYPEFFVFWRFNFERLKRELEALDYKVRENYGP
jgi:hypothetical protein